AGASLSAHQARRRRPARRSRFRHRYNAELTIEQDALGTWRCGLASWQSTPPEPARESDDSTRFRRDPASQARDVIDDPPRRDVSGEPARRDVGLVDGVRLRFSASASRVDLDLVVDAVGGMLGVDDRQPLWNPARDDAP